MLTAADVGRALDVPGRRPPEAPAQDDAPARAGNLRDTLQDMERNKILTALRKADGVQKDAARLLGVSPKNLWNKIQKHRIEAAEYAATPSS